MQSDEPFTKSQTDRITPEIRTVAVTDAPAIWQLVNTSGALDVNSRYCYLLLCRDFGDTCLVACHDREVVGFLTAYRPPARQDCVFVWQVGVAEKMRGRRLATKLLHALIELPACQEVTYLEATVTPSNQASRRLFHSFAEQRSVECRVEPGFTSESFGNGGHEEEELFRLGPFTNLSQGEQLT